MNKTYEEQLLETFKNRKIFLVPGSVNGKYGIDGLAAIAMMNNPDEVYKGSVFVFCNISLRQLRFLLWENDGYWMITRKIYRKTFAWPTSERKSETIEVAKNMIELILDSVGSSRREIMFDCFKGSKYWQ